MRKNGIFLCKPLASASTDELHEFFLVPQEERVAELLAQVPAEEIAEQYLSNYSEIKTDQNIFCIQSGPDLFKLVVTNYFVEFISAENEVSSEPYWKFEQTAGRFECSVFYSLSKILMVHLPGSLVKARRNLMGGRLIQHPIVPMPKVSGGEIGVIEMELEQITRTTGILFEQHLDNLDYSNFAFISVGEYSFLLRRYFDNRILA